MKLRKFGKCSLAVALIFGSVGALAGCKKDNDTLHNNSEQYKIYQLATESGYQGTYEEWLVSIKGDKGETGAKGDKGDTGAKGEKGDKGDKGDPGNDGSNGQNGTNGRDGATWLSGTVDPTNEGKNGDFYVNTSTWDIFKKENNVWNKIGSLKEEKEEKTIELKANGVYQVEQEDGPLVITLDENKEISSARFVTPVSGELNYFLLGLTHEKYYLKAISDTEAVFVEIDQENPDNKPNEAEINKKYMINNQSITVSMYGDINTYVINGNITLTGISYNPFELDSNFTAVSYYDVTEMFMSIEVKDNYIYATLGQGSSFQVLALVVDEENDEYTKLKFLEKLDSEMLKYVVGTYTEVNVAGRTVAITMFEDEFYMYDENSDTRIRGTWEYVPVESSINNGYTIEFSSESIEFTGELDCYSRKLEVGSRYEYMYDHVYYNDDVNSIIELIKNVDDEDVYIVKYNGEIITSINNNFNNKDIINFRYKDKIYELNAFTSSFTISDAYVDNDDIISNMNNSIDYIDTFYNLPANTDVDEMLDESRFYVLVGYLSDSNATNPIIYFSNHNSYDDQSVAISVGNNNFINRKLWKVEDDALYISSLILKQNLLMEGGNLSVTYSGRQAFDITDTNTASKTNINVIPTYGIGLNNEHTELIANDNSYEYATEDGTSTIRIFIGNDDYLGDVKVFTSKTSSYGDNISKKYGYIKLDKIDDGYYIVLYPKYSETGYENEEIYSLEYSFFMDNGMYGNYKFNITLSPKTGE